MRSLAILAACIGVFSLSACGGRGPCGQTNCSSTCGSATCPAAQAKAAHPPGCTKACCAVPAATK